MALKMIVDRAWALALTGAVLVVLVAGLIGAQSSGAQSSGSGVNAPLIKAAPGGMSLTIEAPARLPEEIVVLNPHGDVTVTEFFDYFCHVCQRIGAELQEIAREDGNIRVVYREFPIINGQESVMLSRLALATYNQGIYLDVHNAFMETHGRLDFDGAVRIIQGLGGDIKEVERDFRDQQIIEKLQANVDFGVSNRLSATPSFIIGRNAMQGYPGREGLLEMVAALREEQAQTGN